MRSSVGSNGIAYARPAPRPDLVDAAKWLALEVLPPEPIYAVGFIGAHDARGSRSQV